MIVFGIISDHRALKSKSPAMMTAVLQRQGLRAVYVPFQVHPDRLGEAVAGLRALGVAGANVTVPYKEKVMAHLDVVSDEARTIGAVNTIILREDRLEGRNTDADGFTDALTETGFTPTGSTALVLGAGGAAKAVVYALQSMGAGKVVVAGRTVDKVRAAGLPGVVPTALNSLAGEPVGAELVVNATSVSAAEESPELAAIIENLAEPRCRMVLDLNYGRRDNIWERLAQRHGAPFADGLAMLAHQARQSFKLWTGLDVDVSEFKDALKE